MDTVLVVIVTDYRNYILTYKMYNRMERNKKAFSINIHLRNYIFLSHPSH